MAGARRGGSRMFGNGTGGALWRWLALSALIIVIDQLTKVLVIGRFLHGDAVMVTGYFDLVRAHNTGAAFSFLAQASGWQRWFFVTLGLGAAGFIGWMLSRHGGQRLFCLALSLILAGALGNVIDRLWHGYVVDFLQFHWSWLAPVFPGGYFPAFNVADMAITGGAIGLILDELLRVRRGR
jgi:signal peptidase II